MAKKKYTNIGLVKYLESKLGTPYVYGMDGQVFTKTHLNNLKKTYKSIYNDDYVKQVSKSLGKQVFDCSGSINSYIMDDGKNYDPKRDYSSSSIYEKSPLRKHISAYESMPIGSIVWREGHVGTYVGDGYVIETRSAYGKGLEKRKISEGNWKYIVLHPAIEYENETKVETESEPKYSRIIEVLQIRLKKAGYKDKNGHVLVIDGIVDPLTISACPVITKGCKGPIVKSAKRLLIKAGYDIELNTVFDSETTKAVKSFQKVKGIPVTGKIGSKTWKYLTGYLK